MIVYHASSVVVAKPDTLHSREALDFGKGFYVTPLIEQAKHYSRRFLARKKEAVLNIYSLADNWRDGICVKTFEAYDGEWLDFIVANRKLLPVERYDAVEGGVANDRIFRTLDLYMAGDITREQALQRLVHEKPNHQICFLSQSVMDHCLTYIESKRL